MRPRGTIKSRSPGSYRIRYSLGRDPVSGKRKFGTATVRGTRKDAERELVRLIRSVDTGEHVDPSRITVGEWLKLWVATTKSEVSPKTHERYAEIVRCYLQPAFGSIPLQRLTRVIFRRDTTPSIGTPRRELVEPFIAS
jgi:integrase-like protein